MLGDTDYEFIVAKDTATTIAGAPTEMTQTAEHVPYFYDTEAMEKGLAGEDYSPTEGAWVTGERIIFGKMRIPAGGKAELHSHPNEQFAIVLAGTCRMTIGGETGTITAGDIAHIPADTVHSAEILGR